MKLMTVGLIIFAFVIGWATFVESDHGTQASKAIVYNTWWFESLLVYMCLALIVNVFRYKMFAREKISILMFHLSFIIIIIGAAVTRYAGFEGLMLIRENSQSNIIHSADAYVQVFATDGKMEYKHNKTVLMVDTPSKFLNALGNNNYKTTFKKFDNSGKVKISYEKFISKAVDRLDKDAADGASIIEIITPSPNGGMDTNYVQEGGMLTQEGFVLTYNYPAPVSGAVQVMRQGNSFTIQAPVDLNYMVMSDQSQGTIPVDSVAGFFQGRLYMIGAQNFVFRAHHPKAKLAKVKAENPDEGMDVLYLKVASGNENKIVALEGGQSRIPIPTFFELDGMKFRMAYGALPVETPFHIFLRDFELDRYPGSDSPASYASEVTVVDKELNKSFDKRIFMNSVMDYRGYRFFQSSYDPDEKGTRLSVNSDFWGTNISYFGYLLMIVGMIFTFMAPASRFLQVSKLLAKIEERKKKLLNKSVVIALFLMPSFGLVAQHTDDHHHDHEHHDHDGHDHEGHDHEAHDHEEAAGQIQLTEEMLMQQRKIAATPISLEHAKKLESLVVQDFQGRMKPLHTVALEFLHKIHRKDKYGDLNATQVFMEIMFNLEFIKNEKIIVVNSQEIRELIGITGKYATYVDFFDEITDLYILEEAVAIANQKPEKNRNDFDKQIIKVNERVQLLGSAIYYFRILPVKGAPNNTWYNPFDSQANYTDVDSLMPKFVMEYINGVRLGKLNGDYTQADEYLQYIKDYQKAVGKEVMPSADRIKTEIRYNEMHIFQRLIYVYLILGFALLLIYNIKAFTLNTAWTKPVNIILLIGMIAAFVAHALGLAMRWYVSGHAPWSDGYEALLFITWVGVLAGLLFAKRSMAALGATGLLAFFLLYVAHLNNLDPQIGPLVPVLQSYWLKIHVAVITGSYAFLGLGAVLAIENLLLYISKTKQNNQRLNLHIEELTHIIEMTTTIGLFMLTIGTFLGGIWANESWGRYWGWDPKETWALVSILVYAVLMHLRFIPALKNKLVFNSFAMWAYSAIMFTYFGVNFFLVGLHSYANGEAETLWPSWLTAVVLIFMVFNVLAILRESQVKQQLKQIDLDDK